MLIKYKEYNINEMLELLTARHIYFSRQSSFRGVNRELDTITLYVERDVKSQAGTINISCNIFNNLEGVKGDLYNKQFIRSEHERKFYKVWQIPFEYNLEGNKLCDRIINTLELARNAAPLLLYESNWYKQLQDYNKFMTSNQPRISISEITRYLGYNPNQHFIEKRNKVGERKQQFIISQYEKGLWGVWTIGDEIIPLFPSESDAKYFVERRSYLGSLDPEVAEAVSLGI